MVNLDAMRPGVKDSFIQFENYLSQYRPGMKPLPPILKACSNNPLNSIPTIEKCISDVCSGDVTAIDFNLKSRGFDFGMFPALGPAKAQYDQTQKDLITAVARVPASEMMAENPICQNQQNMEGCRLSNTVLSNHPDLAVANAKYLAQYQALAAAVVPYKAAIDMALKVANASHACCLDAPDCPQAYNSVVVPAANGATPAHR
jgi:hypothetical protein